jgi:hypothetical protein
MIPRGDPATGHLGAEGYSDVEALNAEARNDVPGLARHHAGGASPQAHHRFRLGARRAVGLWRGFAAGVGVSVGGATDAGGAAAVVLYPEQLNFREAALNHWMYGGPPRQATGATTHSSGADRSSQWRSASQPPRGSATSAASVRDSQYDRSSRRHDAPALHTNQKGRRWLGPLHDVAVK